MEWKRASANQDGSIKIPSSWLNLHYYEALNLLFRIENSIRTFVFAVLKTELAEKWVSVSLSTDDDEKGTIGSIGRRRLSQAQDFGYLGYASPCPLMYLSMGELVQLVFSDAYWKYFSSYFAGRKALMKAKLDEIIVIRNALAHFRPLKEDDVEVLRQNAKHALMAIEIYLLGLTRCDDSVPSNSSEHWYKKLSALGGECVSFKFLQNSSADWVRIALRFLTPVLRKTGGHEWINYAVAKISCAAILRKYEKLREKLICLTETSSTRIVTDEFNLEYERTFSFVFRRDVLAKNIDVIHENFEDLVSTIAEEVDLLQKDSLARGELLSVAETFAFWNAFDKDPTKHRWESSAHNLSEPPSADDFPEHWGDLGWLNQEFITKRARYPWMPSEISGFEY